MSPVPGEQLRQCFFCATVNVIDPEHLDKPCLGCGLQPKEYRKAKHPAPLIESVEPPEEPEGTGEPAAAEKPERRRTLKGVPKWAWAATAAGFVAVVVLVPLGVITSQASGGGAADETDVLTFSSDPTWATQLSADEAVSTTGGDWLATVGSDGAVVVDADSGSVLAEQDLVGEPWLYATGDSFIAGSGDDVYTWSADDANTEQWSSVELPEDARLSVRHGAAFVVSEPGKKYDRITVDGELSPVDVPTEGAVPVATTPDGIIWGTNAGVVHVTDFDGEQGESTELVAPSEDAELDRWVGGAGERVVVSWTTDEGDVIAAHSLEDGATGATETLADDSSLKQLVTDDQATMSVAGLLINTTTGAIIQPSVTPEHVIGGEFAGTDEGEPVLIAPDGAVQTIANQNVEPLARTTEGLLVVAAGDYLAALSPEGE